MVGAGPAGSAVAAALAARGRDVLLVESRAHPRAKACAEYASPRIVEELRAAGPGRSRLEGRCPAAGRACASSAATMRSTSATATTADRGRPGAWNGPGSTRPWRRMRSRAGARLMEHTVVRGRGLARRRGRDRGPRGPGDGPADAEGRRGVRCRWLIGADGARSRVQPGDLRGARWRDAAPARAGGALRGRPRACGARRDARRAGLVRGPGAAGRRPAQRRDGAAAERRPAPGGGALRGGHRRDPGRGRAAARARNGSRRSSARRRSATACGAPRDRAGCWSATRPASSTRSPARGSTAPCARRGPRPRR